MVGRCLETTAAAVSPCVTCELTLLFEVNDYAEAVNRDTHRKMQSKLVK